ncbi:hypothetical protein F8280_11205 [Micromonospora noduli]|uniref:hypothetical protein n=1 Tax=Micromonospora noduli TaxID=709876 RepID=UPI00124B1742|nr:hypothetical protein [Micromonospora noduli]KAB1925830.1 hypothetical protein F8280_11205 [Micromonospora noduli]
MRYWAKLGWPVRFCMARLVRAALWRMVVLVAWCGGVLVDDESGEELPVGVAADAGLTGWIRKPSSRAMSVTAESRSWMRRLVRSPEKARSSAERSRKLPMASIL